MPIWEITPKDKVRTVLLYENALRPFFWLQVGQDGSLYFGPRYEQLNTLKRGKVELPAGESSLRINYADGCDLDAASNEGAKVSVHASGRVNIPRAGDEPPFSTTVLRSLTDQVLICQLVFSHPSAFSPVDAVRKRDIVLGEIVDEERPLHGLLCAAPADRVEVVMPGEAVKWQMNLVLICRELEDAPDLALQLVLRNGPTGPWPPSSYVVIRASEPEDSAIP